MTSERTVIMSVVKEKAVIKYYSSYGDNSSFGTYDWNVQGFLQLPVKGIVYRIPVKYECEDTEPYYKLLKLFPMANRISDFLGITVGIDVSSKGYILDVYRVPETISEKEFNERLAKRYHLKKDNYKNVDIRKVLETEEDFI